MYSKVVRVRVCDNGFDDTGGESEEEGRKKTEDNNWFIREFTLLMCMSSLLPLSYLPFSLPEKSDQIKPPPSPPSSSSLGVFLWSIKSGRIYAGGAAQAQRDEQAVDVLVLAGSFDAPLLVQRPPESFHCWGGSKAPSPPRMDECKASFSPSLFFWCAYYRPRWLTCCPTGYYLDRARVAWPVRKFLELVMDEPAQD